MPVFRRFGILKTIFFFSSDTCTFIFELFSVAHRPHTQQYRLCALLCSSTHCHSWLQPFPAGHSVTGTVWPLYLFPQAYSQSRAMHRSMAVFMWTAWQRCLQLHGNDSRADVTASQVYNFMGLNEIKPLYINTATTLAFKSTSTFSRNPKIRILIANARHVSFIKVKTSSLSSFPFTFPKLQVYTVLFETKNYLYLK